MEKCPLRQVWEEDLTLKTNEYKVRFCIRNTLFVEIDNGVIEIVNPYDYNPKTVELVKVLGTYYVKGFEPKKKKATKEEVAKDED